MTLGNRPLLEINQQATEILVREMGIVDTLQFFNQFTLGSGDYTQERGQWLDHLSLKDIVAEIRAEQEDG